MEGLMFFQEKGFWIVTGGLLTVVLLQILTLHRIKKNADIFKGIELELANHGKKERTKEERGEDVSMAEMETLNLPVNEEEGQAPEESPEQLIDAVLAEVFR